MAENFKWLFLYYGWKFFLPFKPLIVELVKDTKDEAMQAICSEILSGFLSTLIRYGHIKESQHHYKEIFNLILDSFEEASDDVCRDWESGIDFFMHETDPRRLEFLFDDLFKK